MIPVSSERKCADLPSTAAPLLGLVSTPYWLSLSKTISLNPRMFPSWKEILFGSGQALKAFDKKTRERLFYNNVRNDKTPLYLLNGDLETLKRFSRLTAFIAKFFSLVINLAVWTLRGLSVWFFPNFIIIFELIPGLNWFFFWSPRLTANKRFGGMVASLKSEVISAPLLSPNRLGKVMADREQWLGRWDLTVHVSVIVRTSCFD